MLTSEQEPIIVNKLTTDADGRMHEGFASEMVEHGVKTKHYLDTVHLNRSTAGAISRLRIKPRLITQRPCTHKLRQQAKNRLADSMAWRAESEVRAARLKCAKHNKKVLVKTVAKSIPAIVECYQGKHVQCKSHSLVCNGESPEYAYLPKFACGSFRFTKHDAKLLAKTLEKRMGKEALRKTRFSFTTQKAEATNHVFATTNPKHSMKCSRNGVNRDHSAIHMLNNPVGDSILTKARACGVPLSPNSPCISTLHHMNKRQAYFRARSHSQAFLRRRAFLRRIRYREYDRIRNDSCYIKGQLDPK